MDDDAQNEFSNDAQDESSWDRTRERSRQLWHWDESTAIPYQPDANDWNKIPKELFVIPENKVCDWAGRKCKFTRLKMNGVETRTLIVAPGTRVKLEGKYHAYWSYNPQDYCPGCIVQVYIGMPGVFCEGLIEFGVHNHVGNFDSSFTMPNEPGEYCIQFGISLMYSFVVNFKEKQPIDPANSIARILVIPPLWSDRMIEYMRNSDRQLLRTLLLMAQHFPDNHPNAGKARHPESHWHKLPLEIITKIFGYLLPSLLSNEPVPLPPQSLASDIDRSSISSPRKTCVTH